MGRMSKTEAFIIIAGLAFLWYQGALAEVERYIREGH